MQDTRYYTKHTNWAGRFWHVTPACLPDSVECSLCEYLISYTVLNDFSPTFTFNWLQYWNGWVKHELWCCIVDFRMVAQKGRGQMAWCHTHGQQACCLWGIWATHVAGKEIDSRTFQPQRSSSATKQFHYVKCSDTSETVCCRSISPTTTTDMLSF